MSQGGLCARQGHIQEHHRHGFFPAQQGDHDGIAAVLGQGGGHDPGAVLRRGAEKRRVGVGIGFGGILGRGQFDAVEDGAPAAFAEGLRRLDAQAAICLPVTMPPAPSTATSGYCLSACTISGTSTMVAISPQ